MQRRLVRLSPWGEQILFAATEQAELWVPAAELSSLWELEHAECVDKYGDWSNLLGANVP